ncbi:MAG TPA: RHS repeat-associated core domain-containing protein [Tahibacter sp.]|nr:RHS repeat-associated core domain-containing protein [Tahibacter sp.]
MRRSLRWIAYALPLRWIDRAQRASLVALTAALVAGGVASAPRPAMAGIAEAQPMPSAAKTDDAVARLSDYAERLETIASLVRAASAKDRLGNPRDGQRPTAQAWNDPLRLARRIDDEARKLAGLEIVLDREVQNDREAVIAHGGSAEQLAQVVEQHNLIRARLAEFRDLIAPLSARVASARSSADVAEPIEALAGFLAPFTTSRAYDPVRPQSIDRMLAAPHTDPPALDPAVLRARSGGAAESVEPAAPGPGDLGESDEIQLTPGIRALAQQLGNDPIKIRDWVANTIAYLPTYGSIQGAELTRVNAHGNAFDQASLLIALLRAAGTPARYVYGTIEIPAETAQSLTLAPTAPMAVNLLQLGGIPTGSVVAAGQIRAVRMEHVWVEAWVDFVPSRGAINRQPDSWVPIDVAIKQQRVVEALPLETVAPFDPAQVAQRFVASATVSPDGLSATRYDFDVLQQAMLQHGAAIDTYVAQSAPDATMRDLWRHAALQPQTRTVLEGTLPYRVMATGSRFSAAPDNLKHFVNVHMYASYTDWRYESPSLSWRTPTSKIGLAPLGVRYVPANAATEQALRAFGESTATSMPLAGLSVVPTLELDGVAVASTGATRMGTENFWDAYVSGPHNPSAGSFEPYRFTAGTEAVLSLDAAGITTSMMKARSERLAPTREQPLREGLAMAGWTYWLFHRLAERQAADTWNSVTTPLPSVGAFSAPLNVRYFFGVPRTGFMNGYATDVKAVSFAVAPKDAQSLKNLVLQAGAQGSFYEGAAWEMVFNLPLGGGGSASSLLMRANDNGIPIYTITPANAAQILPRLQIGADALSEIQASLASGYHVTVSERELDVGAFSGVGYVIFRPDTGGGIYRVTGGSNGFILAAYCLSKAVFLNCIFDKLIWYFYDRMIGQLVRLAGNTRIGWVLRNAVQRVALSVVLAQAQHYIMFQALHMAMTEIAIALATDDIEGLALAYGIDLPAIEASLVACMLPSPCGGPGAPGTGGGGGDGDGGGGGPGYQGSGQGNPVFTATGAKFQGETDYAGSGEFPLNYRRTYFSMSPIASALGFHWRGSYERELNVRWRQANDQDITNQPPLAVLVIRDDGSYMEFVDDRGTLRTHTDYPTTLRRLADGAGETTGFEYVNEDDETERYAPDGRLLTITNRVGLTQTLTWNALGRIESVADPFGRKLTFSYNDIGMLESVRDPANEAYTFAYQRNGMLQSVTYPGGKLRRYHYEGLKAGQLTGITDERGIRLSTYRYDYRGRVLESTHADGADRHQFAYLDDNVTVVTNPYGLQTRYEHNELYEGSFRLARTSQPCVSCGGNDVAEQRFDALGFLAASVDFNHNETRYRNDARGLALEVTEAFGTPFQRRTLIDWHTQYRLPARLVEPVQGGDRTTVFTYDGANLRTRTVTAGGESRVWTYTYNGRGQVLTEDGPRTDVSDVVTYTYDTATGNRATATDARGKVTRYTDYDAHGRLREMIDPNGLITQYRYDTRGRLTHAIEKTGAADPGETTVMAYDDAGNLAKLTLPDGSFVAYTHDDAGRVDSTTDSLGDSVHYVVDALGNRTLETTRGADGTLAQSLARAIDQLGRLQTLQGATPAQRVTYTYDDNGNERTTTDAFSRTTTYTYDVLNRLSRIDSLPAADPDHAATIYGYDAADNLVRVTDPRTLVTSYAHNGFDELTTLISPDTGTTRATYDASGNLATSTDARAQRVVQRYDAADRLVESRYGTADAAQPNNPAALSSVEETLSYAYDEPHGGDGADGRLTSAVDGAATTRYSYDRHGRPTATNQVLGSGGPALTRATTHRYDALGRLEASTLPSGAVVGYAYGADGRVLTITVNGVVVVKDVEYFPFGDPKSWSEGGAAGAFRYERRFDEDGRIVGHDLGDAERGIDYDDGGRIVALDDDGGIEAAHWTYTYDGQDRLKGAANAATQGPVSNLSLAWLYDATGNRMSQTTARGGPADTDAYTIDAASNRIASIDGVARTYGAAGNTDSNGTHRFSSNARNRMSVARLQGTGAVLARYAYNTRGERVCKASGDSYCPVGPGSNAPADAGSGTFTQYTYDDDGRLVGVYANDGRLIAEHVWLEGVPVAVIKPAGAVASHGGLDAGGVAVFWIEPDHIDTPRLVVNAAHQPVWRWENTPFGDADADANPGGRGAFAFDLRFPGQVFDVETHMHYNINRDYEPGTGRYIQSDPIGLDGGINTYGYVNQSPVDSFDPDGLRGSKPKPKPPAPCRTKNCLGYKGKCYVYMIKQPNGKTWKYGESCGPKQKRCDDQVRRLNRTLPPNAKKKYECEIVHKCRGKAAARKKETELIQEYKDKNCNCRPPGNKSDH